MAIPLPEQPPGSTSYRPSPPGTSVAGERPVAIQISDEAGSDSGAVTLAPLSAVLDTIELGIVLMRSDSRPGFVNATARRLLVADAEHGVLGRELRAVARAAMCQGARASAEVDVATSTGRYRMQATPLLRDTPGSGGQTVLVTIERARTTVPSREFVMRRFAMTAREADVALLLGRGFRNAAIAAELGISPHTARHHTENVLAKLNVHARAEVARALATGSTVDATIGRNAR